MTPILIDGSILEGGGQILRNSISLSALLSKSVSIHKIRNGRKPPGLKNQHRTGLELAANIASAELRGATSGSTEIDFVPGTPRLPGHFTADSVTAGATTLMLQIALPILLFSHQPAPSSLILKGGTNASHAPQIDYTQHVFLPFVRKHFGIDAALEIKRRGYYPKGGGEVHVQVSPVADKIRAFTLVERGGVKAIRGIAHLAGLPGHIGKGMVEGAKRSLAGNSDLHDVPVEIESKRERNDNTVGAGSGIVLWAELEGGGIIGGDALGRKGLDAQAVGRLAAESLIRGLSAGGCVDEWLQDQIIIFMALAEGTSEIKCAKGELELHTKTAIWVAQRLTDVKFEVELDSSGCTLIRCQGIGHSLQGINR
ncbi:RNA 3'-terminal phosphate cyclase domain-containing protein [Armillaria mellea]|nr:RNA 3'-terminal phosphate cyclase domain-containing protein [Armillaria mellea]